MLKLNAFLLLFCPPLIFAQNVAVNNSGSKADSSAMLDISSTSKGLLPPRMTMDQIKSIKKPVAGLLAYNTTVKKPVYFDGTAWRFFNDSLMTPPVSGVNVDKATAAFNARRSSGFGAYPPVNPIKWNDTLSKAAFNFAKDVALPGNEMNTYNTNTGGFILDYVAALQYKGGAAYFALCYFYPETADEKIMIDEGFTNSANNSLVIGGFMEPAAKQFGMAYYSNRWYLIMSK